MFFYRDVSQLSVESLPVDRQNAETIALGVPMGICEIQGMMHGHQHWIPPDCEFHPGSLPIPDH
jgi:hypothetical protein